MLTWEEGNLILARERELDRLGSFWVQEIEAVVDPFDWLHLFKEQLWREAFARECRLRFRFLEASPLREFRDLSQ